MQIEWRFNKTSSGAYVERSATCAACQMQFSLEAWNRWRMLTRRIVSRPSVSAVKEKSRLPHRGIRKWHDREIKLTVGSLLVYPRSSLSSFFHFFFTRAASIYWNNFWVAAEEIRFLANKCLISIKTSASRQNSNFFLLFGRDCVRLFHTVRWSRGNWSLRLLTIIFTVAARFILSFIFRITIA